MGHLAKALQILPVRSSQSQQEGICLYRHRHRMRTLSFCEERDVACQHFYPPSILNTYTSALPTKDATLSFCDTSHPLAPQEKIHLPSIRTGRSNLSIRLSPPLLVLFSSTPSILCASWARVGWATGVDMYDQTGMEIGWWSISHRYSGYTDYCKILSTSHYNKLYSDKNLYCVQTEWFHDLNFRKMDPSWNSHTATQIQGVDS